MGGGKKKKPISAMEKETKKEEVKKPEKREKQVSAFYDVDEGILKKALSTVKGVDVVTTYQLASSLGVRMSTARRILKELSSRGDVEVLDKFRALIIAVPKQNV